MTERREDEPRTEQPDLSFRTKVGEGFRDAKLTTGRRLLEDKQRATTERPKRTTDR